MNKTLQDNVWSILPKEFKDEVKRMWSVEVDCATKYHSELHKHRVDLLYELFGEHLHWQNNLTSDAEGEEICNTRKTRKMNDKTITAFALGKQEKDGIDLKKLNEMLDDTLKKETKESLNQWLSEKDADTVTINKGKYYKLCKCSRYMANWVPYFDVCPI